jgi:DNA-binding GntR family transcriptional regulator
VPGPWTPYLGAGARVFRIDRAINIGDEFSVFSSFYADSERLRPLLRLPIDTLDAANFKLVMSRELRLPITEIEQQARVQPFPRRICAAIEIPPGTVGLKLEVAARAGSASFIYYQEIYIPPNRRALDIQSSGLTR